MSFGTGFGEVVVGGCMLVRWEWMRNDWNMREDRDNWETREKNEKQEKTRFYSEIGNSYATVESK